MLKKAVDFPAKVGSAADIVVILSTMFLLQNVFLFDGFMNCGIIPEDWEIVLLELIQEMKYDTPTQTVTE